MSNPRDVTVGTGSAALRATVAKLNLELDRERDKTTLLIEQVGQLRAQNRALLQRNIVLNRKLRRG